MRQIAIAALGLLISAPIASAQGCGPTRLKVTESATLDISPAQAWSIIGDFQDLSWDRTTIATKGSGGNQPEKATRSITLKDGAVFGESLYKYDAEGMSYSYHVDKIDVARLPVQNLSATIEVQPGSDALKSVVKWRAVFYRYLKPNEPAPDIADADAAKAVSVYLRTALDGLRKADAKT